MLADNPDFNRDAAVQVAHAFTTNSVEIITLPFGFWITGAAAEDCDAALRKDTEELHSNLTYFLSYFSLWNDRSARLSCHRS